MENHNEQKNQQQVNKFHSRKIYSVQPTSKNNKKHFSQKKNNNNNVHNNQQFSLKQDVGYDSDDSSEQSFDNEVWNLFPVNQNPIEMAPVIKETLAYGRSTFIIGIQHGIKSLENILDDATLTIDGNVEAIIIDEIKKLKKIVDDAKKI